MDADLTYCSGRFLLLSDEFFFRTSGGYLLHQAAEKYLKALRKILCPQIDVEKHGHELIKILNDIKTKAKTISIDKLKKSIEKIEPLRKLRYVDLGATKDIKTMEDGLKAVDYLVMCVRKKIEELPYDITDKAIKRYIEVLKDKDEVLDRMTYCLIHKNLFAEYWVTHLSGVDEELDYKLKKYQTDR